MVVFATKRRWDSRIILELTAPFGVATQSSERPPHDENKLGLFRLIEEADIRRTTVRRWMLGSGLISLILSLACGATSGLCGAALLALLFFLRVRGAAAKRRLSLERDLPALLTALAASVRAGVDPLAALERAKEYFDQESVIRRELELFHEALSLGVSDEVAISRFGGAIRHPDLDLVRACLTLSRRQGSALADPLHRVTRVIRQRQSFRRKTRAALAMHRMSAFGIALCAILICGIQMAMNFNGISLALKHPVGFKALLAGVLLMFTGVVWMSCFGREREA